MASTFKKIKHAAKRLPRYLGSDEKSSELAKRFEKGLDSYEASVKSSHKDVEEAANGLCQLFAKDGEWDRMLQQTDRIPDSKNIAFYQCAAEVRDALVKADRLTPFLEDLNAPSARAERTAPPTTRNPRTARGGTRPSFRYTDIPQYQRQQKDILASWKSEPLVEGEGDHADLGALINRGLLEQYLYTPAGKLTYQDFYTQKIEPEDNAVIALRGRLGVGKTQLTQYIVLNKIAENEDNIILFIGQRSSAATKEGKQLLQVFKDRKLRPAKKFTGKFYIIIDEPNADRLRWNKGDWVKLRDAAKSYQAKIILLVRDHSSDEDLIQHFLVDSDHIVLLQEALTPIPLPEGGMQWIDPKKIPGSLLDEFRRLPLSRLPIDNRLWRLSNQSLSSSEALTSCFRSAYALAEMLYVTRFRDKEGRTGSSRKTPYGEDFCQQCDDLLQYMALKLCQNNMSVSWTEGAPDHLPLWDLLIQDGFISNIIKIESRKGQQNQSVIKGFYHSPFYNYFLVREVRDRLVNNEELPEILSLMADKNGDMLKYNMLADGLCALANDQKLSAIKNLEKLKADKKFVKPPYKEIISTLMDLLRD